MTPDAPTSIGDAVERALDTFFTDLAAALPDVLAGLLFLVVAALLVRLVMVGVRWLLGGVLPGESTVYRQFVATIVAVFLWFGVALAFLGILGLEAVAAALGTASGFLALGVSYALSGMLADAVAGIYLLRDPDFNPGDTVSVGTMTGDVTTIELRKTRFRVDGDTVVRANAEIEKQWTKEGEPAPTDAAA
jgi:small-conductance mechanosensitive channel